MPTSAEYQPFEASHVGQNSPDQASTTWKFGEGFTLAGDIRPDPVVWNEKDTVWEDATSVDKTLEEVHSAVGIVSKFSLEQFALFWEAVPSIFKSSVSFHCSHVALPQAPTFVPGAHGVKRGLAALQEYLDTHSIISRPLPASSIIDQDEFAENVNRFVRDDIAEFRLAKVGFDQLSKFKFVVTPSQALKILPDSETHGEVFSVVCKIYEREFKAAICRTEPRSNACNQFIRNLKAMSLNAHFQDRLTPKVLARIRAMEMVRRCE